MLYKSHWLAVRLFLSYHIDNYYRLGKVDKLEPVLKEH